MKPYPRLVIRNKMDEPSVHGLEVLLDGKDLTHSLSHIKFEAGTETNICVVTLTMYAVVDIDSAVIVEEQKI